jgi:hypothetical protein
MFGMDKAIVYHRGMKKGGKRRHDGHSCLICSTATKEKYHLLFLLFNDEERKHVRDICERQSTIITFRQSIATRPFVSSSIVVRK